MLTVVDCTLLPNAESLRYLQVERILNEITSLLYMLSTFKMARLHIIDVHNYSGSSINYHYKRHLTGWTKFVSTRSVTNQLFCYSNQLSYYFLFLHAAHRYVVGGIMSVRAGVRPVSMITYKPKTNGRNFTKLVRDVVVEATSDEMIRF